MPVRHPVAPRPHTEFLFDAAWIDRRPGTQRVLGVPRKLPQPVFAFEPGRYPWEVPGTLNKHSVLYDAEEGRFKLWYRSTIPPDGGPPGDPRWGFRGRISAGCSAGCCATRRARTASAGSARRWGWCRSGGTRGTTSWWTRGRGSTACSTAWSRIPAIRTRRAVCALEPGGWVKADLLDELGEVVPGWGAAECATRDDGDGWTSFWWDGQNGRNGQVSAAGGTLSHIVKVRFHLRAATLYAFSVGEEEVPADRPSGFTAALRAREGQGGSR